MSNVFDLQFKAPVCGIDEVGRGPLCGPVTSVCALIKPKSLDNPLWKSVTDSKKLTAKKRDMLYDFLIDSCFYGIAEASAQEVDQLNIHHATLLAMKRAYEAMVTAGCPAIETALIDGKFSPDIPCSTQTVIKGDSLSLSIGAASIIAKVTRDRLMVKLHEEFPYYAWDRNAGYGTKDHMAGLDSHGLTPYHRMSFAPCAKRMNAKINS